MDIEKIIEEKIKLYEREILVSEKHKTMELEYFYKGKLDAYEEFRQLIKYYNEK